MAMLAAHDIHVHLYGNYTHGRWREWIAAVRGVAPAHLHLHANVDPDGEVREFTRYDAGWLHYFPSFNGGDLHAATWDDLNYPARLATFAAAGLPMLQLDNPGSTVATQRLLRDQHLGLLFAGVPDLAARLRDVEQMACLGRSVREQRDTFTFDHHADRLISFFRAVAAGRAAAVPHA